MKLREKEVSKFNSELLGSYTTTYDSLYELLLKSHYICIFFWKPSKGREIFTTPEYNRKMI